MESAIYRAACLTYLTRWPKLFGLRKTIEGYSQAPDAFLSFKFGGAMNSFGKYLAIDTFAHRAQRWAMPIEPVMAGSWIP